MTHQVIAFTRSMRREAANTASAPLSFISEPCCSARTNHTATTSHTVALTIALRYLAAHNRIPDGLVPGIRQKQSTLK